MSSIPKEEVLSLHNFKMEESLPNEETFVKRKNVKKEEEPKSKHKILVKIIGLEKMSESERAKFHQRLLDPKNPLIIIKNFSKKVIDVSDS